MSLRRSEATEAISGVLEKIEIAACPSVAAKKQLESIERMAELGCDGIMFYDDWGLQDRLMVRRELIVEFFMPGYRRNWQRAHELGLDVWMHSCGMIVDPPTKAC